MVDSQNRLLYFPGFSKCLEMKRGLLVTWTWQAEASQAHLSCNTASQWGQHSQEPRAGEALKLPLHGNIQGESTVRGCVFLSGGNNECFCLWALPSRPRSSYSKEPSSLVFKGKEERVSTPIVQLFLEAHNSSAPTHPAHRKVTVQIQSLFSFTCSFCLGADHERITRM